MGRVKRRNVATGGRVAIATLPSENRRLAPREKEENNTQALARSEMVEILEGIARNPECTRETE